MKKSTLIEGHELGRYLKIRELVKEYSNDMELGGKIRALFWESKPHYPSKEMRESWNET
jgi:hypothetical protein